MRATPNGSRDSGCSVAGGKGGEADQGWQRRMGQSSSRSSITTFFFFGGGGLPLSFLASDFSFLALAEGSGFLDGLLVLAGCCPWPSYADGMGQRDRDTAECDRA